MSDVEQKKANKAKKKKNKPAPAANGSAPAAAAPPSEAQLALKENPNASGDGQWEAVVDVRKKKAEERRKKKTSDDNKGDAVPADEKTAAESSKNRDVNDYVPKAAKVKNVNGTGNKQQQQGDKKKKKADPPAVKRPNNENELVAVISKILDDTPQRFLQVAAIGDRLQVCFDVHCARPVSVTEAA